MLCNGVRIEAWAFNPNNVLSWEDSAGHTAWLLFMALPGGPLVLGNVITPEQSAPSSEALLCPERRCQSYSLELIQWVERDFAAIT